MIRILFILVFFASLFSCETNNDNTSNATEQSSSIKNSDNPEKLKDNKIKTH